MFGSVETIFKESRKMSAELLPGLGHNNPPEVTEEMAREQAQIHADKLAEIENRISKEAGVPDKIDNDESAGQASDFVKLAKATIKEAENIRLAEKKKYTVKSDAIQSFWKKRLNPLEDAIVRVSDRLAPYLKAKEDQKRRAIEEKARADKELADKKLREAQEKEKEALEKQRLAEEETRRIEAENERKKKEAAAEAERLRQESVIAAAIIEADAENAVFDARAEAAKKKKEADEADRKRREKILADQAEADADLARKKKEADEAEQRRKDADKGAKIARDQAKEIIKTGNADAKAVISDAKDEIEENEVGLYELKKEAREATRDSNTALDVAVRADKDHQRSEKKTLAGSAELSRTRGDASVASIREEYTGEVADRDKLDLESLRDHIPFEALNQAVRSWVKSNDGNRNLRGAFIYQETKMGTR